MVLNPTFDLGAGLVEEALHLDLIGPFVASLCKAELIKHDAPQWVPRYPAWNSRGSN